MKSILAGAGRTLALFWEKPGLAFLGALVVYALFSSLLDGPFGVSTNPYFNYLADAFLHGQLSFRLMPPSTHDLVFYGGKLYAYWPAFPALLLMPWVAVFGVNFSDVAFTWVLGAANVSLVAMTLRAACDEGLAELPAIARGILVLFFAFGTVHLVLASMGDVWYTSQVIAFLCLALAFLAALRLHGPLAYLLVGLAVSCALGTRLHMAVGGLFPIYWLLRRDWKLGWRTWLPRLLAAGIFPLLALVLTGFYNYSRFGGITDVGIAYHNMHQAFRADYAQYGYLSLHYVPINLYYQYIFYPFFARDELFFMGGSLFLLSPVFFGFFGGLWRGRRLADTWVLLATIMLINIPILLLMGTGWLTFGPRYTLDFTLPLLLLTARGVQKWPIRYLVLLTVISIVHYVLGFIIFAGAH